MRASHHLIRSNFMTTFAVLLALFCTLIQVSQAGADFRGDILIDDNVSAKILAFKPGTGQFDGVFATIPGGYGPSYMAEGPNGNIYIGLYFNGSAIEFNGATGAQVSSFRLQAPANAIITGLAFDTAGHLYAANAKGATTGTIDQYDPNTGAFIKNIAGGLETPRGLVIANDNIYVSFNGTAHPGAVNEYSLGGNFVRQFAVNLNTNSPQGLTLGTNGNLFVTDAQSSVYQFTLNGVQVGLGAYATIHDSSVSSFAVYGSGFTPDGILFVTSDTGPTYRFDSSGNQIGTGAFISRGDQTNGPYYFPYPVQPIYDAAVVPEPSSIVLILSGSSILFGARLFFRKRQAA